MALTPANFPDSLSATNEDRYIFDVGDITQDLLTRCPALRLALTSEILHCWVEFLLTNEVKPHVAFKFNFREGFSLGEDLNFISCRLAMDLECNDEGDLGPGACVLKILSYTVRTETARAAFQFRVNGRWTLREAISVLQGHHPRLPANMRGDLTVFHFVAIPQPSGADALYDGCRDWIAQAFVRLHALGMVEWDIEGIVGTEREGKELSKDRNLELHSSERERFSPLPGSGCPPINWHTAGFHDVIGKFFQKAETTRFRDDRGRWYEAPRVYYRRLDLEEGLFRPSVLRFYMSRRGTPVHVLPYRSQLQPQGGPGGPGGGPAWGGSGQGWHVGGGGFGTGGAHGGSTAYGGGSLGSYAGGANYGGLGYGGTRHGSHATSGTHDTSERAAGSTTPASQAASPSGKSRNPVSKAHATAPKPGSAGETTGRFGKKANGGLDPRKEGLLAPTTTATGPGQVSKTTRSQTPKTMGRQTSKTPGSSTWTTMGLEVSKTAVGSTSKTTGSQNSKMTGSQALEPMGVRVPGTAEGSISKSSGPLVGSTKNGVAGAKARSAGSGSKLIGAPSSDMKPSGNSNSKLMSLPIR